MVAYFTAMEQIKDRHTACFTPWNRLDKEVSHGMLTSLSWNIFRTKLSGTTTQDATLLPLEKVRTTVTYRMLRLLHCCRTDSTGHTGYSFGCHTAWFHCYGCTGLHVALSMLALLMCYFGGTFLLHLQIDFLYILFILKAID